MPLPNRLAVYITAAGALALGLLPLVGNLDWTSTAGVLGAIVAISGVVAVWLNNWGKYERGEGDRILPGEEFDELAYDDELELDDGFDETTAAPIPPHVTAAAVEPEHGNVATGSPPPPRQPKRKP